MLTKWLTSEASVKAIDCNITLYSTLSNPPIPNFVKSQSLLIIEWVADFLLVKNENNMTFSRHTASANALYKDDLRFSTLPKETNKIWKIKVYPFDFPTRFRGEPC